MKGTRLQTKIYIGKKVALEYVHGEMGGTKGEIMKMVGNYYFAKRHKRPYPSSRCIKMS